MKKYTFKPSCSSGIDKELFETIEQQIDFKNDPSLFLAGDEMLICGAAQLCFKKKLIVGFLKEVGIKEEESFFHKNRAILTDKLATGVFQYKLVSLTKGFSTN